MLDGPVLGVFTRRQVVNRIEKAIRPLLPRQQDIRQGISKIVDTAVELAHRMTSEKALFTCEMVSSGEGERENYTSVPEDGEAGGTVCACVFPFFGKRVMTGPEGKETLQVVALRPASVIYEREMR